MRDSARLPLDVRREMIDTLFGKPKVLVLGLIGHSVCCLVAYGATADRVYFGWIAFFAVLFVLRTLQLLAYRSASASISTDAELAKWERFYTIGGTTVAGGVGCFAAYSVITAPHTIAPVIGMGIVGGSMITVVGRNFGSLRNGKAMTLACCVPLLLGFVIGGYVQDEAILIAASIPLGIVISASLEMTKYLNTLMVGALRDRRTSEINLTRFNDAIASMPNGLMIVDGDDRIVVANEQSSTMLGQVCAPNALLGDVLRAALADGRGETLDIGRASAADDDDVFETVDGRWLTFGTRKLQAGEHQYLDEEWGGRQEGAFVVTVMDQTSKVQSDRRMEYLARYDGLSGIANRRYWEESALEAVTTAPQGSLVGLAVMDVDKFKLVNDTLGHHIGDGVIAGVAARIAAFGDRRVWAGRLGGDEFVCLVIGTDHASVVATFDEVFASICGRYEIEGHEVEVKASGGVVIREACEFNLHADLSRADLALYMSKRDPDRTWTLFDAALEEEYESAQRIKHDLKEAIAEGKLDVVYQPIFDLTGKRIVSAEALCRWNHPEAGRIPPSKFVPMAEEIGIIGQLTEYVLATACRDAKAWGDGVSVAVNLSAIDLAREHIVETVIGALERHGLSPHRLCIEVTETVFVKDFEKTAATLAALRDIGVRTALDDFGTGYSSLSYMHRLPLDKVKIDRSFVIPLSEDEKTKRLFRAVVGLAKQLGFEVVVEGVETREQLSAVVSTMGVDNVQGYLFSKEKKAFEIAEAAAAQFRDRAREAAE